MSDYEGSEQSRRRRVVAIPRLMEPGETMAPLRHLVAGGQPLCPEGRVLLERKNATPAAPEQRDFDTYVDWGHRK